MCGRDNPHGLHLRLSVNDASGLVTAASTPAVHHVGFADVVHGGLIATIADEAMVWAATWRMRWFCYCGSLDVRFRKPARPGTAIRVEASVAGVRGKVITTAFRCVGPDGEELSSGSGRYVPLMEADNAKVFESFIDEPDSREAARILRSVVA